MDTEPEIGATCWLADHGWHESTILFIIDDWIVVEKNHQPRNEKPGVYRRDRVCLDRGD